ncbi:Protein-arginine-phosphatase [Rubrobacter xylanophilus DSM 9941]|uniref:low molecular weight protein arginine phosphatase n=1 Tax=Rubrobacter xylanophilus TaxID=49319 RepID=UPI001C641C4A|nr:low molecular weight protein arginine phosphatase [Rubrobacter xylanophilus]QYJ15066.1 Protein-arginine-phosphatase [Rubrobacter xylanophilus DSM 9941]
MGATKERPKTVLFVCTANICRSPMAAALFNALAEERSLPHRAESAGVAALEGAGMAPYAREALAELGIRDEGHRAQQVSRELLERADLVLVMGPRHLREIERSFGSSRKVYTLRGFVGEADGEEIPDPYGFTAHAYRASLRQLLEYVEGVLERLREEESSSQ